MNPEGLDRSEYNSGLEYHIARNELKERARSNRADRNSTVSDLVGGARIIMANVNSAPAEEYRKTVLELFSKFDKEEDVPDEELIKISKRFGYQPEMAIALWRLMRIKH